MEQPWDSGTASVWAFLLIVFGLISIICYHFGIMQSDDGGTSFWFWFGVLLIIVGAVWGYSTTYKLATKQIEP